MPSSTEALLAKFIGRYTPEVAALAKAVLTKMRARLPGAVQMVYDNYNALVVGFGPTERASEAVFSIALYPRWVNLYFLWGAGLPDPEGVLKGSGKQVRFITLKSPEDLDAPAVRTVMQAALDAAGTKLDDAKNARLVIRAIAERQRARVPRTKAAKAK
jgi:hypothetical protein